MKNRKKLIILHCNPDDHCVAAEVQLINKYSSDFIVDSINLVKLTNYLHQNGKFFDFVYEKIDRKYEKFIKKKINGRDLTKEIKYTKSIFQLPDKITELRKLKVNDVALGLATLSTAAGYSGCTSIECKDYGNYIKDAIRVASLAYNIGLSLVEYRYDFAIIFNGRFAISRPIAEILRKKSNTNIIYYEFDGERRQLMESINSTFTQEEIVKRILNLDRSINYSNEFFLRKINKNWNKIETKIRSTQIIGKFPECLINKRYAVFFTSSPDEYFAVYDQINLTEEFNSQFDVAYSLAKECINNNMIAVIRLHPHLKYKHESWKNEWDFEKLQEMNCFIVWPDSVFDTYEILKNSEVVITAGSTIGIEASYFKKPIANVGKSIASLVGCAFEISTEAELKKFIKTPHVQRDAYDLAIICGEYFLNQKDPFLSIEHEDNAFRINSTIISPSKYWRNRVKSFINFILNIYKK